MQSVKDPLVTRFFPPQPLKEDRAADRLLVPFRMQGTRLDPCPPLLLPAGAALEREWEGDGALLLSFPPESARLSSSLLSQPDSRAYVLYPGCSERLLRWLMDTLLLIEEMQRSGESIAALACQHLADAALQLILLQISESTPARHGSRTAPGALIEETQRYVESHFNENISLTQIAGQLFITPSYLSRIFHRLTGMTFVAFLQNTRLEKAKELLETSSLSVTQIALATGLGTSSHLGSLFKKSYGISPSAFRRTAVKNRYLHQK